jgi:multicomponent Na+:H+ antiporter subunit G
MNIVSVIVMSFGLFFLSVTVIGLIRLPGFFARVHAVSKSETLGLALVFTGLMLHEGMTLLSLKYALIILFVSLANPVGAHVLTRAAVRTGVLPPRTHRPNDAPAPPQTPEEGTR